MLRQLLHHPLPDRNLAHALLSDCGLRGQLFRHNGATYICLLPRTVLTSFPDGRTERIERLPDLSYTNAAPENMGLLPSLKHELPAFASCLPPDGNAGRFQGGLVGWLGYNPSRLSTKRGPALPSACFGFYDTFIRMDDNTCILHSPDHRIISHLLGYGHSRTDFRLLRPFKAMTSRSDYRQAFERVRDYLHAGDCYQVNLAQDFISECAGNSLDAFLLLDELMCPPHAQYATQPDADILCLSPELFLRFDQGEVSTRPIKGTRPRGRDQAEDSALHADLAAHPKDRAENLMIVDLLRNDLGRHAAVGSVRTTELFRIESFTHVHHMVSEIRCRLRAGSHPLDLLFDAAPGGSITGAPKRRAMEIIHELEDFERTVYCGTMGWLTPDGQGEWNIAIRTLVRSGDRIHAWAGGGIVADSRWESEYDECYNKIGPILRALEQRFLEPGRSSGQIQERDL